MDRKSGYIMLSVAAGALLAGVIDAVVRPGYLVKSLLKLTFFFLLPMAFFLRRREEREAFRALFLFQKKGLLRSLALGIGVYGVILAGYFLTRHFIDFSHVTTDLTQGMGITAGNFVYVSLYISFVNSFLEEFFFRGYGFLVLKRHTGRGAAYLFSAVAFALYHVGMLMGMFSVWVWLLMLAGLVIGGGIFDWLDEKSGSVYSSWFVHMFANFAINTVGFILFGVL